MMNRLCVFATFTCMVLPRCATAQTKAITMRGTVQDSGTTKPVAGATVSAAGDAAQQNEVTDSAGFFRLIVEGTAAGDLVRIRVEKAGYVVYDRQVVASEELPLTIMLRKSIAAAGPTKITTPAKAAPATKPLASANPVVQHYLQQMAGSDAAVRSNAVDVLAGKTSDKAALAALIAALVDQDAGVRLKAISYIVSLKIMEKDAVTNLIIDTGDVDGDVRSAAIAALGGFPANRDAMSTLIETLGKPPDINVQAMASLIQTGAQNENLNHAVLYEAEAGDAQATAALLKKMPLSPTALQDVMDKLRDSLRTAPNYQQQTLINLVLQDGEAGHNALYNFLNTAGPRDRAQLVLCWLEVDHSARQEILQHADVPGLTTQLTSDMNSTGVTTTVSLPERPDATPVHLGSNLRATMGLLVLDLPQTDAWNFLAGTIVEDSMPEAAKIYAQIVPRWIDPAKARKMQDLLVATLDCHTKYTKINHNISAETLAVIGDESTIRLLQKMSAQNAVNCANTEDLDAINASRLAILVQRIRAHEKQ